MSARFHTTGRDPLTVAPQTQWQRERMRGPIQPMERKRRLWFPFRRLGR